jgi:hypothetical protein
MGYAHRAKAGLLADTTEIDLPIGYGYADVAGGAGCLSIRVRVRYGYVSCLVVVASRRRRQVMGGGGGGGEGYVSARADFSSSKDGGRVVTLQR